MEENTFISNIFADLSLLDEEKDKIIKSFKQVNFKKGDFLFKEGQTLDKYYFLETGFIRSFMFDFDGNEVTTNFYSEKEIVIDWASFMLRTPTQEYFQANIECVCWSLSFQEFQMLFNSIKQFREAGRKRLTNSYFKLKKNHLSVISKTAKERYQLLVNEHPEIIDNASLKHIATYLGITDTSLSRIRKELSK